MFYPTSSADRIADCGCPNMISSPYFDECCDRCLISIAKNISHFTYETTIDSKITPLEISTLNQAYGKCISILSQRYKRQHRNINDIESQTSFIPPEEMYDEH